MEAEITVAEDAPPPAQGEAGPAALPLGEASERLAAGLDREKAAETSLLRAAALRQEHESAAAQMPVVYTAEPTAPFTPVPSAAAAPEVSAPETPAASAPPPLPDVTMLLSQIMSQQQAMGEVMALLLTAREPAAPAAQPPQAAQAPAAPGVQAAAPRQRREQPEHGRIWPPDRGLGTAPPAVPRTGAPAPARPAEPLFDAALESVGRFIISVPVPQPTLIALCFAACFWLVALAGVCGQIDVRPTVSEGFLRYEYFLVWAELVALAHMSWSILSRRPPWIRGSSLLLMSIVTAISITHTNAQMAELDTLFTSLSAGTPHPTLGVVVTGEHVFAARAYVAGILSWCVLNTAAIMLLCMELSAESERAWAAVNAAAGCTPRARSTAAPAEADEERAAPAGAEDDVDDVEAARGSSSRRAARAAAPSSERAR